MRFWLAILTIEILVIGTVVGIFRHISDRPIAALLAGSVFLLTALAIFIILLIRGFHFSYFSFWAIGIFLFAVCVPLVGTRVLNWGQPFASLRIWGIPGPQFHSIASASYLIVIGSAFIDLVFSFKKKKSS